MFRPCRRMAHPVGAAILWEHHHHRTRYSKMLIQLNVAISLLALVNEWEILKTTMWSNRVERSGWGRVAGIM